MILKTEKGFNIQNSIALKRFNSIFDKQNFGLITSGLIKGKIAYVVMISIGASIGTVYHKDVYLKCIEIIAQALIENKRKLDKSDEEVAESIAALTSKLMPTIESEDDLYYILEKYLVEFNPNFSLPVDSNNTDQKCFYHKSKFDYVDFDNIVDKCYEELRLALKLSSN